MTNLRIRLITLISMLVMVTFLNFYLSIPTALKEGSFSKSEVVLHYLFWRPYLMLGLNLLVNPIVLRIGYILNLDGSSMIWSLGPIVMATIYGLVLGQVLVIIRSKVGLGTAPKKSK